MTFVRYFNSQFSMVQNLDFFIRIIVACVCGACIGLERSKHNKEAGIKTHIVVCCGAAMFMIISKYGFVDLTDAEGNALNGIRGADSARIAAQVVSGISFLGVGVIYRHGSRVKGLTTAAGIWTTAAIGLAIGAGMYWVAVFGTLVISLLRIVLKRFALDSDFSGAYRIKFSGRPEEAFVNTLVRRLERQGSQITHTKVSKKEENKVEYEIIIKTSHEIHSDEIYQFANSGMADGSLDEFVVTRM